MAINPAIALAAAKEAVDTLKKGIKEAGKTIRNGQAEKGKTERKKAEEESATAQKKTEEKARVKRHQADVTKENRDKEIDSHTNTTNRASDNTADIANTAINSYKDSADNLTENMVKIQDKNNDHIQKANEYHQEDLKKKDKLIKNYSDMLQVAYMQVSEYKIRREIDREISQKIMNYVELMGIYDEKIKNLKDDTERREARLEPLQAELSEIEIDMKILQSKYTDLNSEFEKHIHSMEELKFEYKSAMEKTKYIENETRIKRKIENLMGDILDMELLILRKEQDRLCKIEEISPVQDALEEAIISLKILKNEQEKKQNIGRHKMSNLQMEDKNESQVEAIDAQILEESASNNIQMKYD